MTGVQRSPQILHLFARVIDLVFALDIETDDLVQARQDVPYDSHTSVTDMKGTGRIDTLANSTCTFLPRPISGVPFFPRQVPSIFDNKIAMKT